MDELQFKAYNTITQKYQSVLQRLLDDKGPPRRVKVTFRDRRTMDILYGDESFLEDVKDSLTKLVMREKESRGMET